MAGVFPAMGNPAAGVGAASGLGNQFLGFLQNLPQQIMQWEQIKQVRQDNAYKNMQALVTLGSTMPQVSQDPRFAQKFGQTVQSLGLDPKAFMGPNGTINMSVFQGPAMKQLLSDPTVFKQYIETPPEQRGALWNALGETGDAPDAFIKGPYRIPITPAISNQFSNLPDDTLKVGPLAALQKLQAIAPALISNGYDIAPMQQAIMNVATGPQYAAMLQKFADAHHMKVADYNKAVAQTNEAIAHTGLYGAQTAESQARTTELIPSEVRKNDATTNTLIPSEATKNYAQANEADVLAQLNGIKVKNAQDLRDYVQQNKFVPGTSADTVTKQQQEWNRQRGAMADNLRKAVGTRTALYSAYGLINSANGQPLTGDAYKTAYDALPPEAKKNIDAVNSAVQASEEAERYANTNLYKAMGTHAPLGKPVGHYKDGRPVFMENGRYVFADHTAVPGQ